MSQLTDEPDLMLEVLAALVRRAGGSVVLDASDAMGPFNLASRWNDGKLYLSLHDNLTAEDVESLRRSGIN